jgi:hypothetical protein
MKALHGFVLALAGMAAAAPSYAVKYGELDGQRHPQVGLMVAYDADFRPMWRCSGTLLGPRLYLTAGHCTSGASHVAIWFQDDLTNAAAVGYPSYGGGQARGTPHTHPQYIDSAFFLFDLGVVVLDEPYTVSEYATLPQQDELDRLESRRGQQDVTFTAVGYGLQRAFPDAASWKDEARRIRMLAEPRLLQINTGFTGTQSLMLSNNANTGGTCFGDSGGPNFIGGSLVVGGVTSFAISGTCSGTGGVYRVDRADDLNWLYSEFGALIP